MCCCSEPPGLLDPRNPLGGHPGRKTVHGSVPRCWQSTEGRPPPLRPHGLRSTCPLSPMPPHLPASWGRVVYCGSAQPPCGLLPPPQEGRSTRPCAGPAHGRTSPPGSRARGVASGAVAHRTVHAGVVLSAWECGGSCGSSGHSERTRRSRVDVCRFTVDSSRGSLQILGFALEVGAGVAPLGHILLEGRSPRVCSPL